MFDNYKEIFAKRGINYQNAMEIAPQARNEEFLNAVRILDVKSNATLIDLPSGGGYLACYLQSNTRCVFVETSEQFYNACQPSGDNRKLMGDFTHVPMASNSADYLVCLAALHHVDNMSAFFNETKRLLKVDGEFLIVDVPQYCQSAAFLDQFVDAHNSMGHRGAFIRPATYQALLDTGFHVIHDERVNMRWHFDSQQQMLDFCRGLFGLDLASDNQIMQGLQEYLDVEIEEHCSFAWTLCYIKVVK